MKKYVSATLYKEGIRRTRTMGIVLLLIFVIASALPIVTLVVQRQLGELRGFSPPLLASTNMAGIAPLLTGFIFLGPVLFTMSLFSFLNKRRASDFYHAIPHTRKCVLFSFSLAIFTWLAVIIGASLLINSLWMVIFPGFGIHLRSVIFGFLTFFLGAILVTGAMLLAKSISGTGLSNLVIGGMIVFYPSIIHVLFSGLLVLITRVLPMNNVPLVWNFNIPIRAMTPLDTMSFIQESFLEGVVFPLIYTFVLSLLYFALAGFLLHRRKAETAGRGAPNKVLQHLFRCLLVFPLTLVVTGIIVTTLEEEGLFMYVSGILLFLACLIPIVYFTYELLTTRRPKNLIPAIPVFGFVILANIFFVAGLYGSREIIWRSAPTAEEIVGVREITSLRGSWGSRGGPPTYNELLTRDLYIHNHRLHSYIAQELQTSIERARRGEGDERVGDTSWVPRRVTVSIQRVNGRTIQREIPLPPAQRTYLQYYAGLSDPIYAELLAKLPDFSANEFFRLYSPEDKPDVVLDDAFDWQRLWAMYAREYERLTGEQQLLHNGMRFQGQEGAFFFIAFNGRIGNEGFRNVYRVTGQTPETLAFLMEVSSQDD